MKKIFAILMALCLFCGVALAETTEINWADVAAALEQSGVDGDFVSFDEVAVKLWLPGDLSPYAELSRLQPNCKAVYDGARIEVIRYFPSKTIKETTTEEEYRATIDELGRIMSNNMALIAKKWPGKKVSISVTGGRDSMTTLACTNGNYDKYSYFSYISNDDEAVDAYAAKDILKSLGLEHELYRIPDEWDGYKDIDLFEKIMECNAGCIGKNNRNDLKKRKSTS